MKRWFFYASGFSGDLFAPKIDKLLDIKLAEGFAPLVLVLLRINEFKCTTYTKIIRAFQRLLVD